jgi:IS5 family transposase
MAGQPGFFDLDERYRALSAAGDALERLARAVEFELFRPPTWRRRYSARIGPRAAGRPTTRC